MEFRSPKTEGRHIVNLGRYPREEILDVMLVEYQKLGSHKPIVDDGYYLSELVQEWFDKYVLPRSPSSNIRPEFQLSKYTVKNYRTSVRILKRHGYRIDLSTWNIGIYEDLLLQLRGEYAPRTVHLIISLFKQAFHWGIKREKQIKVFDLENKRPTREQHVGNHRTPSTEEVSRMYNNLRKTKFKVLFFLLWKTGCRVGEILELKYSNIKRHNNFFMIEVSGKTGHRTVPLSFSDSSELSSLLGDDVSDDGRIFPIHYRTTVYCTLERACNRLNIEQFTPHALRRLRSDTLFRSNIEPAVYEAIMGHSTKVAIQSYRRVNLDDLANACEKVDDLPSPTILLSTDELIKELKARGMDVSSQKIPTIR